MRILAATPYYTPEGGGLERYAHETLRRLAARGHDVEAVAFTLGGASEQVLDGVRIHRMTPRFRAGNTPIDPGFAASLRGRVRASRPDMMLLHTPVPFPAQAAAAVARREGIPYVVTYHAGSLRGSSPVLGAVAALDRWTLERRMLANASALVAVSPYVREHALQRHRTRTTVIPPGVDADRFLPNGRCKGQTVLFVGPLAKAYRWKGIDILWRAFKQVRHRMPDARLRIVGAGDRFPEFQEKVRESSLNVQLMGRVPDERFPRIYQDASVTVLPSLTDAESFGMVLAEANACGRPVVASNVGGIPDFVRDGDNGYLARPGDPFDLANRILTVLQDPDSAAAMGRRGRERVVKEHDWDALTVRTEMVLETALARSAPLAQTQPT